MSVYNAGKSIGKEMVSYRHMISFIWRFMKLQRGTFLLCLLLDVCAWPLDVLVWPFILRSLVDIFARYEANRFAVGSALISPILGGVALVLFVESASRTMGFLMDRALPKLQSDIRLHMFDHIQYHTPRYFNERFAGSLANKMTDMTTQVELILQQLFFPIVPAVAACILGAGFLFFVNPIFTWFLLGWTMIHLSICIFFTRSVDAYEHRHGEARSTLLGKIVDSFTNNFAVNLFYRFSYEKQLILPFQEKERKSNQEAKYYVEKMRCVLSFFYFVAVILGMFGTLIYLWMHNRITTGEVVQVFTTMWSLAMILWTVGSSLPVLFQSFGIAKQAYSVMRDPEDLGDKSNAKPLVVSSGEIVFENVSFSYGDNALFVNKQAHFDGGEKVGL